MGFSLVLLVLLFFLGIAGLLFAASQRIRLGGDFGGGALSSYTLESTLAAFEESCRALGSPTMSVEVKWGPSDSGMAGANSPRGDRLYDVKLRVRGDSIPSFLQLSYTHHPALQSLRDSWRNAFIDRLSPDQRRELLWAVERERLRIFDGEVACKKIVSSQLPGDRVRVLLHDAQEAALTAATHLSTLGPDAARWLVEVIDEVSSPEERAERLDLLCRHYPSNEETEAACETALDAGSSAEKVVAGARLGWERLVPYCDDLKPTEIPPELWLPALDALGRRLSLERLRPLLDRSLAMDAPGIIRRALDRYRELQEAPAVEPLAEATRLLRDPEALLLVVEALGRSPEVTAELPLIDLLGRSSRAPTSWRPRLRRAVVLALGRRGTVRAVPALRRLEADRAAPAELRHACTDAVEFIQARVDGGSGGLAVVEPTGGALALTATGGELAEVVAAADDDDRDDS